MNISKMVKPIALSLMLMGGMSIPMAMADENGMSSGQHIAQTNTQSMQDNGTTTETPDKTQGVNQDRHPHGHHHHPMQCGYSELKLSQTEKDKLKTLGQSFRQKTASSMEDIKAKRHQLRALYHDKAKNKAQIASLKQEIDQEYQTVLDKHDDMLQSVFTPAQFQQYKTMEQQCQSQFQDTKTTEQ